MYSFDSLLRVQVCERLGCGSDQLTLHRVSGGDINRCYSVSAPDNVTLFVKANTDINVLRSEYSALVKMAELGTASYPAIVDFTVLEGNAVLVLECLQLTALTETSASEAGLVLARQHAISAERFGWDENGHIGRSPQRNQWCDDWGEFFASRRLVPQLEQALINGLSAQVAKRVEAVINGLREYIDVQSVVPALLHGDLWAGNIAHCNDWSAPCLYDPAPYFGDAEADIAMSSLFGSLPAGFYASYRRRRPEPSDFRQRVAIYNLYHALNHVNLFGLGYENLILNLCNQTDNG